MAKWQKHFISGKQFQKGQMATLTVSATAERKYDKGMHAAFAQQ